MGTPVPDQRPTYTSAKDATATNRVSGLAASRRVAADNAIIGAVLGSIIAAIMTVHAATKATKSASVGAMTMPIPAMSFMEEVERMTSTQASAATATRATHVPTVHRSARRVATESAGVIPATLTSRCPRAPGSGA